MHTPHRDKLRGHCAAPSTWWPSPALARDRVLVDHLNEMTVGVAADTGCWLGFSIYPDTKMDEHRMVAILSEYGLERMLVNSAADWGTQRPAARPAQVGEAMLAAGFTEDDVDQVLWRNPVEFYGQSGRLDSSWTSRAARDAAFEGNSILRGGE